jgi:hypothetical protein
MVTPEQFKETCDKLAAIFTPEQLEVLKEVHNQRRECATDMKGCCTNACATPAAK